MSGSDLYHVNRRTFLRRGGIAGVVLATPGALAACASDDEEGEGEGGDGTAAITGLFPLSGLFADTGQRLDQGSRLAVDEMRNAAGETVRFDAVDTQGDAERALRTVSEALGEGTRYFTGTALSSNALAVAEQVNRGGGMFTTAVGADEVTGTGCQKATFRWSLPTYSAVRDTVIPMIEEDPSLKRWYAITPKYVFGESLLKNAEEVLPEHGATIVGNSFHSLEETEFGSYINQAVAAEPDVILLLSFGAQAASVVRQVAAFGLKERAKVLLAYSEGLAQLEGLGPQTTTGVYFGSQYWHTVDTPGSKHLIELTQAKYDTMPDYTVAAGYIATKLILLGMEEAGSTRPEDVIGATEGLKYEGPTGQEEVRPEDHQVIKKYYLLKGREPSAMANEFDYCDIVAEGASVPPVGATGCEMPELGA